MLQSKQEKEKECQDLLKQYMEKKGYKCYYTLPRELERMMGIVEFHFFDYKYDKKEILAFRSYQQMIDRLTEKLKEANEKSD
ncbi:hypothetical protein [Helicobacter pylori]|uniref:hypothetical protein n=1 Tax=Helicobacter pylori TaxID=210 RepID=UPI000FDEE120|nr:hypothetical protein [Helicobacter pylori]RVY95431.1 hypothetical protein EC513_08105 [Helicobacter pylori]